MKHNDKENIHAADWEVKKISNQAALKIVIEHHYLHRMAPAEYSYGLYKKDQDSVVYGCVIYGTPSSSTLRIGIAGRENGLNVLELTRLFVFQHVGKNAESFLIGRSLRLLEKEQSKRIIISHADPSEGHIGSVYKATNFKYYGLTEKKKDYTIEGVSKTGQTLSDKYSLDELKAIKGFSVKERTRKHRYIYILGKPDIKILYQEQPFPRKESGGESGNKVDNNEHIARNESMARAIPLAKQEKLF